MRTSFFTFALFSAKGADFQLKRGVSPHEFDARMNKR